MIKFRNEYSQFVHSQEVANLLLYLRQCVEKRNGLLKYEKTIEFLNNSNDPSIDKLEPILNLQCKFFDYLDVLYDMRPTGYKNHDFSFNRDFDDLSELENKIKQVLGFYTICFSINFTLMLFHWAGLVRILGRKAMGYGQNLPVEYKQNDARINIILECLRSLFIEGNPYSTGENEILLLHLERNIDNIFKYFGANRDNRITHDWSNGIYAVTRQNRIKFLIEEKNNTLQNIITILVQVEACFEVLILNLRLLWDDLRTGGHLCIPSLKTCYIEPYVEIFSKFPENVSHDEKLYATLFSLKRYDNEYISDNLKRLLYKNDCLLIDAKKIINQRWPEDLKEFILKWLPLLDVLYDTWREKKGFLARADEHSLNESFIKLIPGLSWPFSDEAFSEIVAALKKCETTKDKKRTYAKMMIALIKCEFERRYNENYVEKLIQSVIEEKKRQDFILSLAYRH
jgi:hypothetical protein